MTPFQILRAVLKCLADERTLKPSYFMERGPEADTPPPPPPMNFKGSAEVVFVDPSGWVNIAAHASRAALIQVGLPILNCQTPFCVNVMKCAESWTSKVLGGLDRTYK